MKQIENYNTHESRRSVVNRLERKYKIRRFGASVVGLGLLINGYMYLNHNYETNRRKDDSFEKKVINSIEHHKNNPKFRVYNGTIVLDKDANIRTEPKVTEDKGGTAPNLIDASSLLQDYDGSPIRIDHPIVSIDETNPANGIWYGFRVKEDEATNTYWVNGQNVKSKTKGLEVVDGNIGLVSFEKQIASVDD